MARLELHSGKPGSTWVASDYTGPEDVARALSSGWALCLLVGESAWEEALRVRKFLAANGFNHLAVGAVDSWEEKVARVSLDAILDARKALMEQSLIGEAPSRLSGGKRVSRRALMLRGASALLEYLDYPIVSRPEVCLAARGCMACVDSCPKRALAGKPPRLDPSLCNGCMECIAACRTAALTTPTLTLEGFRRFLEALPPSAPRRLVLAPWHVLPAVKSEYNGPPALFLPVESVAGVHPRLLLEAEVAGFSVFRAEPSEEGVVLAPASVTSHYASTVKVDPDACDLCGACAKACPERALKVTFDGEVYSLEFNPSFCLSCGACAAACPAGALELLVGAEPASWGAWATAASSPAHRCPSCGRPFAPAKQVARVRRRLEEAGLPRQLVERALLCPSCKAAATAREMLRQAR